MTNNERLSVLAVEDEAMIAMELADMLGDLGYAVSGPVPTVEDALACLRRSKPDAAVLDLNLAGDSAAPVLEALRTMGIPFVIASGYEQNEFESSGGDGPRLRKPYSARDLARALAAAGVFPTTATR